MERGARRPEAVTATRGGQRSPRPCPFLPHGASPAELPSWVQGRQGRSGGQGAHLGGQVGRTCAGGQGGRVVVTLHQKERRLGGMSRGAQRLSQQGHSWSWDLGGPGGMGRELAATLGWPPSVLHHQELLFPGAPAEHWMFGSRGCRGRWGGRGGGARAFLLGLLPSPLTAPARARLRLLGSPALRLPGSAPSRWDLGRAASCFCDLWAASVSHPAFQHLCAGKQSPVRETP